MNARIVIGVAQRPSRWRTAAPLALGLGLTLTGCAGFRPANTPIERIDPAHGYRRIGPASGVRNPGDVLLLLAFSGGGTRAAAFAYGVLEELRDTPVTTEGKPGRMLDEVDIISGVSGGSFPAAYYGLFGDRIFEDFEEQFLRRNVQTALILQALRPRNLVRLFTPYLSRSDLASQYYDRKIFGGATFADLAAAGGPHININATDLSQGYRFTFDQGQFDVICSDLDVFPISKAVAASSAVPMLLSPITLKNNAGTCNYQLPPYVSGALASRTTDPRRYRAAVALADYQETDRKKFIHLVDGGISDNLGLRPALELAAAAGGVEQVGALAGLEFPQHLAVVVVNAETDPNPKIDLSAASPSFAALMNSVSGSQIRRYNFETILLMRDALRQWASELSRAGRPVTAHLIEVSFDAIDDPQQRRYFKLMPTSFSLQDKEVDDLRAAGRRLLRESPDFGELRHDLDGGD
jgi:NTE family protein